MLGSYTCRGFGCSAFAGSEFLKAFPMLGELGVFESSSLRFLYFVWCCLLVCDVSSKPRVSLERWQIVCQCRCPDFHGSDSIFPGERQLVVWDAACEQVADSSVFAGACRSEFFHVNHDAKKDFSLRG